MTPIKPDGPLVKTAWGTHHDMCPFMRDADLPLDERRPCQCSLIEEVVHSEQRRAVPAIQDRDRRIGLLLDQRNELRGMLVAAGQRCATCGYRPEAQP